MEAMERYHKNFIIDSLTHFIDSWVKRNAIMNGISFHFNQDIIEMETGLKMDEIK